MKEYFAAIGAGIVSLIYASWIKQGSDGKINRAVKDIETLEEKKVSKEVYDESQKAVHSTLKEIKDGLVSMDQKMETKFDKGSEAIQSLETSIVELRATVKKSNGEGGN